MVCGCRNILKIYGWMIVCFRSVDGTFKLIDDPIVMNKGSTSRQCRSRSDCCSLLSISESSCFLVVFFFFLYVEPGSSRNVIGSARLQHMQSSKWLFTTNSANKLFGLCFTCRWSETPKADFLATGFKYNTRSYNVVLVYIFNIPYNLKSSKS